MANASHKKFGKGLHGKGDALGAITLSDIDKIRPNGVLSNRDKQQDPRKGGHDGRHVMTEQYEDHATNRIPAEE
ncbi:hypothetical protein [Paracoccus sp. IB05]|uniref:hypothetical protein n=1 Tax=Paracoccus sp. IB05 TaxID=2779367 RepID=UPI0018E7218B|nr:hypothetical protein [Paracoccus sp. IB05]MBJ2150618.1 hypothetical protein [Paracoccus sp. IB05]